MNFGIPQINQLQNQTTYKIDPQSFSEWIPFENVQNTNKSLVLNAYNSYCSWGIPHHSTNHPNYDNKFQINWPYGNPNMWFINITEELLNKLA